MSVLEELGFIVDKQQRLSEVLISEAARIADALLAGRLGELQISGAELEARSHIIFEGAPPRWTDVESAYQSLKKARQLTERPVPAMACTAAFASKDLQANSTSRPNDSDLLIERIKARTLLACLGVTSRRFQPHIAARGARTIRRAIAGELPQVWAALPDFLEDLTDLVESLGKARDTAPDIATARRLGEVHHLFRQFQPESQKAPGTVGGASRKFDTLSVPLPDIRAPEDVRVEELIPPPTSDGGVDRREEQADQPIAARYFRVSSREPGEYQKDTALSAKRAKGALAAMALRDAFAPCNPCVPTAYEIRKTIEVCYERHVEGCPGAALVLASLVWGRTVSAIAAVQWDKQKPKKKDGQDCYLVRGGQPVLWFRPTLPQHASQDYSGLIDRESAGLELSLPAWLGSALRSERAGTAETRLAQARKLIGELRNKYSRQITETRLSGYLYIWLVTNGISRTEAAMIAGHSAEQSPGVYYQSTNVRDLQARHRAFVKEIFSEVPAPLVWPSHTNHRGRFGSRLQARDAIVRRCFQEQIKRLDAMRERFILDPAEFHNRYVAYVSMVLAAATGHRAVNSPFQRRSDLCLQSAELFISDKENRNSVSAQVLAVPPIVCEQWSLYGDHLQALGHGLRYVAPKVTAYIRDVLESKADQLFLIQPRQDFSDGRPFEYRPEPITVGGLRNLLSDTWPLQLNWARHRIATLLAERSDCAHLFLRHDAMGREALGRYSGLSMQDLRKTACLTEEILTDVFEIRGVSGWNTRC